MTHFKYKDIYYLSEKKEKDIPCKKIDLKFRRVISDKKEHFAIIK